MPPASDFSHSCSLGNSFISHAAVLKRRECQSVGNVLIRITGAEARCQVTVVPHVCNPHWAVCTNEYWTVI